MEQSKSVFKLIQQKEHKFGNFTNGERYETFETSQELAGLRMKILREIE